MGVQHYWTGVGARKTPFVICLWMSKIAKQVESCNEHKFILRSGGADGADLAFERGIVDTTNKEVYLPWKYFNKNTSPFWGAPKEAYEIASKHHPNWNNLSNPVKAMMARNVLQILGRDLATPSKFVICWTEDGCESKKTRTSKTGGTGLAIALAGTYGVPVYNLKIRNQNDIDDLIGAYIPY